MKLFKYDQVQTLLQIRRVGERILQIKSSLLSVIHAGTDADDDVGEIASTAKLPCDSYLSTQLASVLATNHLLSRSATLQVKNKSEYNRSLKPFQLVPSPATLRQIKHLLALAVKRRRQVPSVEREKTKKRKNERLEDEMSAKRILSLTN